MTKRISYVAAGALLMATIGFAQQRIADPYPEPIPATDRVISVKFVEFATIPAAALQSLRPLRLRAS
jgi:hypothetical protein